MYICVYVYVSDTHIHTHKHMFGKENDMRLKKDSEGISVLVRRSDFNRNIIENHFFFWSQ